MLTFIKFTFRNATNELRGMPEYYNVLHELYKPARRCGLQSHQQKLENDRNEIGILTETIC